MRRAETSHFYARSQNCENQLLVIRVCPSARPKDKFCSTKKIFVKFDKAQTPLGSALPTFEAV